MDNLEDMKALWVDLNNRITALEEENRRMARDLSQSRRQNAQERLVKKYKMFIIVAFIMIFYTLFFIGFNNMVVEKYRLITMIYWILFFAFEAGVDFYLMQKVKGIDIYNSPVSRIAKQARENWRLHKIAIMVGLPLAIGAVILFGLLLNADRFVIYGMIAG